MDPTIYDVIVHAGIPLASSAVAGAGAYFGVKFAIKDHAQRLDLIMRRQTWEVRKLTVLCTHHSALHPEAAINVDDFPLETNGAFRV
jgi:hypothetical protein